MSPVAMEKVAAWILKTAAMPQTASAKAHNSIAP